MKFEFSAGGIVFRRKDNKTEVLIGQHSQHHGWVFPKGLIGDNIKGESKENTAVREVQEETGILGKVIKELEPVTYWYQFESEKIKKTVHYFLMEYVSGETKDHDFEMENVEWLDFAKIEEKLTYKSDKKVWREAKEIIPNLLIASS